MACRKKTDPVAAEKKDSKKKADKTEVAVEKETAKKKKTNAKIESAESAISNTVEIVEKVEKKKTSKKVKVTDDTDNDIQSVAEAEPKVSAKVKNAKKADQTDSGKEVKSASKKKTKDTIEQPGEVEAEETVKKSSKKTKKTEIPEEIKPVDDDSAIDTKKTVKAKKTTRNEETVETQTVEMPAADNAENLGEVDEYANLPKYSDEDLEMFRERITAVRNEALDELRMLKERLEDLTNYDFAEESMIYSMHMAEQGSEAMEQEKTYAQIQRINEYIKKLDEALQRIKDKTYGICRVCKCLIAKERLLAVPITTLSASYKIQKKCPEDGIDRIEPLR